MCIRKCALILFYLLVPQTLVQSDCQLNLGVDESNPVVILQNDEDSLTIPTQKIINLPENGVVKMLCSGTSWNYELLPKIRQKQRQILTGTCENGRIKIINVGVPQDKPLKCQGSCTADIIKTATRCAANGLIYEIGYKMSTKSSLALINVCHNKDTGETYYTEHTLYWYSGELDYMKVPNFFREQQEFYAQGKLNLYGETSQLNAFTSLLGSEEKAKLYIRDQCRRLSRGHLSPAADFVIATSRRATFAYINTSPQWTDCNANSWSDVEQKVRELARRNQRNYTIITGTHGVLSLPDVNNKLTKLYLIDKNKLPIPEVFWKIIYDKSSKEGISIIGVNNPFVKRESEINKLCDNICQSYGWNKDGQWNILAGGFVYCCKVTDFLRAVQTAPRVDVTNILRGP